MKNLLFLGMMMGMLGMAVETRAQTPDNEAGKSLRISDITVEYQTLNLETLKDGLDKSFYSGSNFGLKTAVYSAYPVLQNIRFNRVDGLFLGIQKDRMNFSNDEFLGIERIEIHGLGGYSLGQEKWQYSLGLETALDESKNFILGAEYYNSTTTEDYWRVGRTENSITSFAGGYDYFDYYHSEGIGFYGLLSLHKSLEIGFSYNNARYSSLDISTDYMLFSGHAYRINPEIDPNYSSIEQQSITLGFSLNPEQNISGSVLSSSFSVKAEIANLPASINDFMYNKFTAESKSYLKINSSTVLQWRLMGGSITGTAPDFKKYSLGGIGTMRAIGYKAMTGNQMLLSNLQMEFGNSDYNEQQNHWPNLRETTLLLFLDSGWSQFADELYISNDPFNGLEAFAFSRLSHNAGVGLSLGIIRFEVAQPLSGVQGATSFWLRLNPTF